MPRGADAVVMVENTEAADDGTVVIVQASVAPGDNVRAPGEDLHAGELAIGAGTVLTPGRVGVLASVGRDTIAAVPRARVGVLSTGDELVTGGAPLGRGQIRDSNRPTLLALLAQAGCDPVDLGVV